MLLCFRHAGGINHSGEGTLASFVGDPKPRYQLAFDWHAIPRATLVGQACFFLRPTQGEKKTPQWEVDHIDAFHDLKILWPPTFSRAFEAKTEGLPRRMQELVYYMEKVVEKFPSQAASTLTVRDIMMSMPWGYHQHGGSIPCLVASSVMWLHGDGKSDLPYLSRQLTGQEALALQGFSHKIQKVISYIHKGQSLTLTQKQLRDLAGNAFNLAVVLAVGTGMAATLPWERASKLRTEVQINDTEVSDDEEEEEEEEEASDGDLSDL